MDTPAQLSDIPNGDVVVMTTEPNIDEGENVFLPDNDQSHNPGIVGYSSNYGGVIPEEGLIQSQGVPSNGSDNAKPLSEAELLPLVRQQLEYYFSKDNMGSDKYLLSQMDGDHYVPISVLGSFNQVKRLTSDTQLLIKAMEESNVLQIDPTLTKVRAVPEKRCVLILREIAKDTPKEEIQLLFSKETCPKFISCDFAENDCWYVTFPGEEDAQEAHRHLREEVRQFRGNPIRARIKNVAAQHTSSVPKPRQQFPYSMPPVQHMPFYPQQSPGVGWPFFDPRYAAQYPNGYPPPPNYTGSQGGGRNYSVGSADRGGERRDSSNREGGVRRGSTGGSVSGKRYDTDKRPVGGGYGGNRFRRDDDRLRNLPNRLRNKRNEEIGQSGAGPLVGGATTDRTDKESDPRKDSTGKPLRQQRPPNRPPQQKLDFAPVNFPPLPTSMDVAPPPPPPPPVVSEEGNPRLADIVRGKKQNEGKGAGSQGGPQSPPTVQSSTDTKSVVTDTVTTTTSSSSEPAVLPATQPAKPTTNPKVSNSHISKDKPINAATSTSGSSKPRPVTGNDSKYTPRPSPVGGTRGSNGARQRPKEYKKPTNSTVAPGNTNRQSKMSPGAVKRTTVPPSLVTVNKEESEEEPLVVSPGSSAGKADRLSYAQMAQQKPKPSPQKQPKSPVSPPGDENPAHSLSSSPSPPTTTLTNEIQPQ